MPIDVTGSVPQHGRAAADTCATPTDECATGTQRHGTDPERAADERDCGNVPIAEALPAGARRAVAAAAQARLLYGRNVDRGAKARARVGLAIVGFVVVYGIIALRLVMFGIVADSRAPHRVIVDDAVATARPDILDRNGEILATDVRVPSLYGEPRRIIDVDEAVELLTADLPDLDANELRERLSSKRGFVWLKRDITPEQEKEIYRQGLPGIGFLNENKRDLSERPGSLAPDRPRQYRQSGHRRHGEVARQPRPRRPAHGGSCHRPAAKSGRARGRSARAARAARRTRRRAREISMRWPPPVSCSTSAPARSSPWCRSPITTRTIRARRTIRRASIG